jgi:Predicted transcriptional regulators
VTRPRIHPSLKGLAVPVGDLRDDPDNPRRHPERNLEAIVASLRDFGQVRPVVALADGTVVAGNGTLEAARRLGWDRLAAVRMAPEGELDRRAYSIADNRTAELARWDLDALGEALGELEASGDWTAAALFLDDLDPRGRGGGAGPAGDDEDDDDGHRGEPPRYRCPRCGREWAGDPKP